jgi:hypothetical protein
LVLCFQNPKKIQRRSVSIFFLSKKTVGAVRAFNKLARTFAAQVETLKRYRGGGEQTMPRGHAVARRPLLGQRVGCSPRKNKWA